MRALVLLLMTSTAALAETQPVTVDQAYAVMGRLLRDFDGPVEALVEGAAPGAGWRLNKGAALPDDPQSLNSFLASDPDAGPFPQKAMLTCQRLGAEGLAAVRAWNGPATGPWAGFAETMAAKIAQDGREADSRSVISCSLRLPLAPGPDDPARMQALLAAEFQRIHALASPAAVMGQKAKDPAMPIRMISVTFPRAVDGTALIALEGYAVQPGP